MSWLKKLFGSSTDAKIETPSPTVEVWGTTPVPTTQPPWTVVNDPTTSKVLDTGGRPSDLPTSGHYASRDSHVLAKEYEYHWKNGKMIEKANWIAEAKICCDVAMHWRAKYEAVEKATQVPWYVVAALHMRESNFNFDKHLHNGDPLSARTVHVPANRPDQGSPPFTWEESAIDAMHLEGLANQHDWSVGATFFRMERWNGLGYRNRDNICMPVNASPYIYSGTIYYTHGKFVADGKIDMSTVDRQLGAMPFLKMLDYREVEMFPTLTVEGQT